MTQDKKPLSDIFDAFVAETQEDFPKTRGRLLILDMDNTRAYGTPNAWKTGLRPKNLPAYVERFAQHWDKDKSSAYARYDGIYRMNVILFGVGAYDTRTPEDIGHMLDHELGHLLVKGARGGGPDIRHESLADVFMIIRHYQRFGADTPFDDPQSTPFARADRFLQTTEIDHLSSFATLALMAQKDSINFNTLSPRQALKLARQIVDENQPPEEHIRFMREAFIDTIIAFQRSPEQGVQSLVDLTLRQPCDNPVYRLGRLLLGEYLKGTVPATGAAINLPAEYFTKAAKDLDNLDRLFAQPLIQRRLQP